MHRVKSALTIVPPSTTSACQSWVLVNVHSKKTVAPDRALSSTAPPVSSVASVSTTLASSFLDQLLALGIAINVHFNAMQIRVLQFRHNVSAIAKQSTIVV